MPRRPAHQSTVILAAIALIVGLCSGVAYSLWATRPRGGGGRSGQSAALRPTAADDDLSAVAAHLDAAACSDDALKHQRAELAALEKQLREREKAVEEAEQRLREKQQDGANNAESAESGSDVKSPSSATAVGASSDEDTASLAAAVPSWLVVPCRTSAKGKECSGHGTCDDKAGTCTCKAGFGGSDCGTSAPGLSVSKWQKSEDALDGLEDGRRLVPLLSTVILLRQGEAEDSSRVRRIKGDIESATSSSAHVTVATREDLPGVLSDQKTPYALIVAEEVTALGKDANLDTAISMMLSTDVDVLGFMTARRRPLRRSDLAVNPRSRGKEGAWSLERDGVYSGRREGDEDNDPVLLPGTRHLDAACTDLHIKNWQLEHVVPSFGYLRHQRYVMFCDRTSRSVIVRRAAFDVDKTQFTVGGTAKGIGALSRPPPAFDEAFNASMAGMFYTNTFATIKSHNAAVRRFFRNGTKVKAALPDGTPKQVATSLAVLAEHAPTRLPGHLMVGTCAECILLAARRRREVHNAAFAERFQVEVYHDETGRASEPVCVKSGGIYGHSNRGLYSPICHRLQRQRDFLTLVKPWLDPAFAPLGDGSKGPQSYGVSLHHGNLFGAMRFREELLWETDGDFDFIAFNASHDQMMRRWKALISHVEKQHGFKTKLNYPEKPWYVQFTKNKTDFQCNARSPLDELTRGRPPQQHLVSVDYQGRRAFMNGFSNPWRGIRSDPGHDYRGRYLAQQGWVLHFTKDSIGCKLDGHNACLPSCNAWHFLLDHNLCSDPELRAGTRNPILVYDAAAQRSDTREDAATGETVLWSARHAGLF